MKNHSNLKFISKGQNAMYRDHSVYTVSQRQGPQTETFHDHISHRLIYMWTCVLEVGIKGKNNWLHLILNMWSCVHMFMCPRSYTCVYLTRIKKADVFIKVELLKVIPFQKHISLMKIKEIKVQKGQMVCFPNVISFSLYIDTPCLLCIQ